MRQKGRVPGWLIAVVLIAAAVLVFVERGVLKPLIRGAGVTVGTSEMGG